MRLAKSKKIYNAAILTTFVSILLLIFIIFSTWMNIEKNRKSSLAFYKESSSTILSYIKSISEKKETDPESIFNILERIKKQNDFFIFFNQSKEPIFTSLKNEKSIQKDFTPGVINIKNTPYYKNFISIKNTENGNITILFAIEMKRYKKALKADIKHSSVMVFIVAALAAGSIFFLFVIKSYREMNIMLKHAGEYTAKVVENMANGLVTIDSSGKIVSYNLTGLELLNLQKDSNLFETDECNRQLLYETINNGTSFSEHDHVKCTKSGETNLSISITPIEEENSGKYGAVIIIRDLTEIKKLERKIRRTEKLAAIGRFAAVVAHEIRNPLSSIKGFGMLFANIFKEDDKKKRYAMLIVSEVDRINRVVTDLLTYSKKIEINPVSTDITSLFDHVIELLKLEIEKKNINLLRIIKDDIPAISIDPERIKQVLLNLLINSIELIDEGGKIEIGVEYLSQSKKICFWVKDSGPGIEKERQKEIFDLFYTTREKGTGLGLAIVQKIIEYHDGTIEVKSPLENSKGTKFSVYLPEEKNTQTGEKE